MSAGLPSDEVADDYKNSLEDLVTNDRYQIGNLTVIARENIEHGEAIARVLENHIQRVGTRFPRQYHSLRGTFSFFFRQRRWPFRNFPKMSFWYSFLLEFSDLE
jgi:pre-mRNA cleavage complex 2 protein Pcf11